LKNLLAVGAMALLLLATAPSSAEEMPSAAPLFALTLTTPDDKPMSFASLKGKPLIVNFWARWCGPCRKEIPDLAEMHAKYHAKGLVIVGVAVEDAGNRDSVREFAKAYEMNYALVIGGVQTSVELMQALGNPKSGLPFTIVIDRQGKIVAKKLGAMNKTDMESAIKQVL
jgi:thiol-disulfide isomerase/thioredoxin